MIGEDVYLRANYSTQENLDSDEDVDSQECVAVMSRRLYTYSMGVMVG